MNYLKTARLFEVSALLGAVVYGAGDEKERAMSKYGMNLCMAFQIIDDTIDRDGYYGIVGRKDSVEEAGIFIEKAVSALTVFGNRQNKLAGIARSISGAARRDHRYGIQDRRAYSGKPRGRGTCDSGALCIQYAGGYAGLGRRTSILCAQAADGQIEGFPDTATIRGVERFSEQRRKPGIRYLHMRA